MKAKQPCALQGLDHSLAGLSGGEQTVRLPILESEGGGLTFGGSDFSLRGCLHVHEDVSHY